MLVFVPSSTMVMLYVFGFRFHLIGSHLEYHSVLDLLELCLRNEIFWVTTMKVGNDSHALFVSVYINQPPKKGLGLRATAC